MRFLLDNPDGEKTKLVTSHLFCCSSLFIKDKKLAVEPLAIDIYYTFSFFCPLLENRLILCEREAYLCVVFNSTKAMAKTSLVHINELSKTQEIPKPLF